MQRFWQWFWSWLYKIVPKSLQRSGLYCQTFRPVVVVTGCGSGIGYALAELLYEHLEYRVVITARPRSLPRLKQRFQESERFWIRALDVIENDQRVTLVDEITENWGGVNILINNAGISYRAVAEHMTEADEQKQMATNYLGPMALIRQILPKMREIGRGKIINVSSVSGMLAMPTMSSYSASKYALEGASEALWYEVKPFGINVSLIQLGFIRSKSFENVYYTKRSHPDQVGDAVYSDFYKYMSPFVAKLMKRSPSTPESIARRILKVIKTENPPLWISATIDAYVFYYLRRWLPRRWLLPFLFNLLPGAKHWGTKHTRRRIPI